jgi:hypothetical protein
MSLMIKVILDSKVIRTIPIPVEPTRLTSSSLEDLRKQVGLREASYSAGSITLPTDITL